MRILRRFWPLILLLAAVIAAWALGLTQQISWAELARNQAALAAWVAAHPIAAPLIYMLIYAVVVPLSLPESAVLTVAGGLLFGTLSGGVLAVLGSTVGAILLFLAVRYHLAEAIAARGGRFLDRIRPGAGTRRLQLSAGDPAGARLPVLAGQSRRRTERHAAAALCRRHGARGHASHLHLRLDRRRPERGAGGGRQARPGIIFSPHILGPLVALAALSLLPIAWRHWKRSDA